MIEIYVGRECDIYIERDRDWMFNKREIYREKYVRNREREREREKEIESKWVYLVESV